MRTAGVNEKKAEQARVVKSATYKTSESAAKTAEQALSRVDSLVTELREVREAVKEVRAEVLQLRAEVLQLRKRVREEVTAPQQAAPSKAAASIRTSYVPPHTQITKP